MRGEEEEEGRGPPLVEGAILVLEQLLAEGEVAWAQGRGRVAGPRPCL